MCEFGSIAILALIGLVLVLFRKKPLNSTTQVAIEPSLITKRQTVVRVTNEKNDKKTQNALGIVGALADKADEHYDEDFANSYSDENINIVCIADGLGQTHTEMSDLAAKKAVESVVEFLSNQSEITSMPNATDTLDKRMSSVLKSAFSYTATVMNEEFGSQYPKAKTTLLVGVETMDWLYIAYVGDGGILMTNGDLSHATMLLFPHHDASGALTRYIMPGKVVGEVTISSFRKSLGEGEIILFGSDGIFENDVERGYKTAYEILTQLRKSHPKSEGGLTTEKINSVFKDFIHEPVYKKLTYPDNQSLAIIITKPALEFWKKENAGATSSNDDMKRGTPDESQN